MRFARHFLSGFLVLCVLSGVCSVGLLAADEPAKPRAADKKVEKKPVETADDDPEPFSAEELKELQKSLKLNDKQLQEFVERIRASRRREREEQRKIEKALAADPRSNPTHEEVGLVKLPAGLRQTINNFCLDRAGNLLVCCGAGRQSMAPRPAGDDKGGAKEPVGVVCVITPEGQTRAQWPLDFGPQAICLASDGTILVGGEGKVARLSAAGKVLLAADAPRILEKKLRQEQEEKQKQEAAKQADAKPGAGDKDKKAERKRKVEDVDAKPAAAEVEAEPRSLLGALFDALSGNTAAPRRTRERAEEERMNAYYESQISSIAAAGAEVFITSPGRMGFEVYRVNASFQEPKKIIGSLPGCCGQMDVQIRDGKLYVAENGRKQVVCYDRDGKRLSSWGSGDRYKLEGFGGCCNPKCLRFGRGNVLYTSEDGSPACIKRFTIDGKLQNVVARPKLGTGCVRVTVDATPDGSRVFVLDTDANQIHVLADKRTHPSHAQVRKIKLADADKPGMVRTMCPDGQGNLLVGLGGRRQQIKVETAPDGQPKVTRTMIDEAPRIKVFAADGKSVATWTAPIAPQAIGVCAAHNMIYVGGGGRLARLDREGRVLQTVDLPGLADQIRLNMEAEQRLQQVLLARQKKAKADVDGKTEPKAEAKPVEPAKPESEADKAKRIEAARDRIDVAGIAISQRDLFVAFRDRMGFAVWRMDHDFGSPQKIVEKLVGCCGQMDIQCSGEKLYAAENARKRVVCFDRDGKQLGSWGNNDRTAVDAFGSCCNPMNLRFGPAGEVYTSESGVGQIKHFTADGKFQGVVANVASSAAGCKHVPIARSPDGRQFFFLDITAQEIIVLEPVAQGVAKK